MRRVQVRAMATPRLLLSGADPQQAQAAKRFGLSQPAAQSTAVKLLVSADGVKELDPGSSITQRDGALRF